MFKSPSLARSSRQAALRGSFVNNLSQARSPATAFFSFFSMVDTMANARDEKVSNLTTTSPEEGRQIDDDPIAHTEKTFWERSWPVFACGAGLWSDGYLQYVSYLITQS